MSMGNQMINYMPQGYRLEYESHDQKVGMKVLA